MTDKLSRWLYAALAALILMLAVIAASASFAWYREIPSNFGDAKITGNIRVSYFERGSGTQEDPFVIHTPTHFYNFAWLQYLGFFNDEVVYFELCADAEDCLIDSGIPESSGVRTLDLEGMVLPPIGTAANPFIGNFNGNGVCIRNATISNSATPEDFSEFPIVSGKTTNKNGDYVSWAPATDSSIAGLFGIVGSYGEQGAAANANTGISDFYLDSITVRTTTSETTVGIVAGYVNASVSGVGVSDCSIVLGSGVSGPVAALGESLSDYSLIGYCTEDATGYATVVEKSTTRGETTWQPINVGDGSGNKWGGSINMESVYNRLDTIRKSATTSDYVAEELVTVDETIEGDGRITITQTLTSTSDSRAFSQFSSDLFPAAGEFSFSAISQDNFGDSYRYLYGRDDEHFTKQVTTVTLKNEFVPAYLISTTDMGHYLNHSAAPAIADSTTAASATKWVYEDAGAGAWYLFYYENGEKYYLTQNGSELTLQTTPATVWQIQSGRIFCTADGVDCYLAYDDGWKLQTAAKYRISDGAGHYLSIADGALTATDESSALYWTFDIPSVMPSGILSATVDDTSYSLLCASDGTLSLTTGTGSRWSNDDGRLYTTVGGTSYYLYYNRTTGAWSTEQLKYWIHSGSDYLSSNGTSVTNKTNQGSATQWIISNAGDAPSGTIYDGTRYLYLSGWYSYSLNMGDSASTWSNDGTGVLSATPDYWTCYITLSNGSWDVTKSATSATALSFTSTAVQLNIVGTNAGTGALPAALQRTETTAQVQEKSAPVTEPSVYPCDTWFPLAVNGKDSVDEDGNLVKASFNVGTDSIAPDTERNTGYVISGSSYRNQTTAWPYKHGDVRVSQYAMSNISTSLGKTSYGTGKTLEILTVTPYTAAQEQETGHLVQRIEDIYNQSNDSVSDALSGFAKSNAETLGLQKYDDTTNQAGTVLSYGARSALHNIFYGNSYIYGLHFMDAAISAEDYTIASKVYINGESYENYQLPRHCIDFNLEEDGRITFFAGTYFSGNSCFFSLHHIERDAQQDIVSIREISKVYEKDLGNGETTHYYLYADGTYSGGYGAGDAAVDTLAFDLAWITNPAASGVEFKNKAVYYFEIPANAGEYALGSVSGKDGAYLFYLDISANNEIEWGWVTPVTNATTTRTYAYPKGVDIVEKAGDPIGITPSATVRLPDAAIGTTVGLSRSGDTVSHTAPTEEGNSATSTYTAVLANPEDTYEGEGSVILSSKVAHATAETDEKGTIYSSEGEEEITTENQYFSASIALSAPLEVIPVREDKDVIVTEEVTRAAQSVQTAALSAEESPVSAASALSAQTVSLAALDDTDSSTSSSTNSGGLVRSLLSKVSAIFTGAAAAEAVPETTEDAVEKRPAYGDDGKPWNLLSDPSLLTWVQTKSNAELLRSVQLEGGADYESLQARLACIEDAEILETVTQRLSDLLRDDVERTSAAADDADEAFAAYVRDPANAAVLRETLLAPESEEYAELFARLESVHSSKLYFELLDALQALQSTPAQTVQTDEDFLAFLYNEETAQQLAALDPASEMAQSVVQRAQEIEDETQRALALEYLAAFDIVPAAEENAAEESAAQRDEAAGAAAEDRAAAPEDADRSEPEDADEGDDPGAPEDTEASDATGAQQAPAD